MSTFGKRDHAMASSRESNEIAFKEWINQLNVFSSAISPDVLSSALDRVFAIAAEVSKLEHDDREACRPEKVRSGNAYGVNIRGRFEAFTCWLKRNGIDCSRVHFGQVLEVNGNGLFCSKPLAAGETVFEVSRDLMMSAEDFLEKDSPISTLARSDPIVSTNPSVALALYLLLEKSKGMESHFKEYLDILPAEVSCLPMFWTQKEIAFMQGLEAGSLIASRLRDFLRYYLHLNILNGRSGGIIQEILGSFFSLQDFFWAMGIVVSRQNPVPLRSDSRKQTYALIPLFDMCNHEAGEDISAAYDIEKEHLLCFSFRSFSKNDEFRIVYGKRRNAELFVYSGFVPNPTGNPYNRVKVWLELENDTLYRLKEMVLQKAGILSLGFCDIESTENKDSQMIQLFRVRIATKDQLLECLRKQKQNEDHTRIPKISEENEKAVMDSIADNFAKEVRLRQKLLQALDEPSGESIFKGDLRNHSSSIRTLLKGEIEALKCHQFNLDATSA